MLMALLVPCALGKQSSTCTEDSNRTGAPGKHRSLVLRDINAVDELARDSQGNRREQHQ